jgi:hypothetical protein
MEDWGERFPRLPICVGSVSPEPFPAGRFVLRTARRDVTLLARSAESRASVVLASATSSLVIGKPRLEMITSSEHYDCLGDRAFVVELRGFWVFGFYRRFICVFGSSVNKFRAQREVFYIPFHSA